MENKHTDTEAKDTKPKPGDVCTLSQQGITRLRTHLEANYIKGGVVSNNTEVSIVDIGACTCWSTNGHTEDCPQKRALVRLPWGGRAFVWLTDLIKVQKEPATC